jgi:DNA-binding beta-propeller fold protein YncE
MNLIIIVLISVTIGSIAMVSVSEGNETNEAATLFSIAEPSTITKLAGYLYPTDNSIVFTIAGNGDSAVVDGFGTSTSSFKYPYGITGDYFNTYLYVSDKFGQCIRQINRFTSEVKTLIIEGGNTTHLSLELQSWHT